MSLAASLWPVLLLTAAMTALGAAALAALLPEDAARLLRRHPGRRHPQGAPAQAWALSVTAGLVLFFALQLALDAAAVPWRRATLAAATLLLFLLLAAAAAWRLRAAAREAREARPADAAMAPSPPRHPPWGTAVVAAVTLAFTWAVSTRRIAIPDFVYHWGLKGKRYHLAGGIDFAFLADPLHLTDHPDYPNLLPSLYAATAHLRGWFDEVSMLGWSILFLLLIGLFARWALARGGARGAWLEAGTALVALVAGMVAVGYDLAGGGDPVIALALLVALPALLRSPGVLGDPQHTDPQLTDPRLDDLRVALAAALAAATKIEGIALAAVLLLARLWVARQAGDGDSRRRWLRRLPWLVLPPALVVLPWLAAAVHHHLFAAANPGAPAAGRLAVLLPAVAEALGTREWHGFAWLALLLPWPLAVRRTRIAALVLALQGGFYLAVYLGAPVDTRFYVLSSLPRLLFHLLLPLLVLLVLLTAAGSDRRA